MAKLSQSNRVAEFKTPLGENALVLVNIEGTEALGDMFEFHIEALSEQENIDFDKALGQGCTLKLKAYGGKQRIFHGVMTEAQWIGNRDDLDECFYPDDDLVLVDNGKRYAHKDGSPYA